MMSQLASRGLVVFALFGTLLIANQPSVAHSQAEVVLGNTGNSQRVSSGTAPTIVMPNPAQGSFFTLYDHAPDGRLVAFDGFTVSIQRALRSTEFVPIGRLPDRFRGGTDPAFIVVDPRGKQVLLGGGAGGSKFPDPAFNGSVFRMPLSGGPAVLVGLFPFSISGVFWNKRTFLMGQGETFGTFTGSVEVLDITGGTTRPLVANIPGDPGGIVLDDRRNLLVGLGAGQDTSRTGEIRRFDRRRVIHALRTGEALDFDRDSELTVQVLNAGDLEIAPRNRLFVGGGSFFGRRDFGYVAVVDLDTNQVVRRFDPVDGDPNDGDERSFDLDLGPTRCGITMVDLFSFFNADPSTLYSVVAC